MLKNEFAIGDYISQNISRIATSKQRRILIALIEDLHRAKKYKEDALFLAISIADRYLAYLSVQKQKQTPCLTHLAVISLLLAAKLE